MCRIRMRKLPAAARRPERAAGSLHSDRKTQTRKVHPMFFGAAAIPPIGELHSKQHLMASRAMAPGRISCFLD